MKKIVFFCLTLILIFIPFVPVEAYVSVKGYYRSDGTYVKPHVRSNPNGLKYDNYSWTPSQGLYNDTYGTRGSYWDTPTYITDPYYYEGKAIYDSGNTPTNVNNNTSGYFGGSSCPENSYYNYSKLTCSCNEDYYLSNNKCISGIQVCVEKYGVESIYNPDTNNCTYCNEGYILNSDKTECIKRQELAFSDLSSNPLRLKIGDLIKVKKFAEVFYVDEALQLHWVVNEKVAEKYFGKAWNQKIVEFDSIPPKYIYSTTFD